MDTSDARHGRGARGDLCEILEERYGRRSTILTSQIPVDKWLAFIGDTTYAHPSSPALYTTIILKISPNCPRGKVIIRKEVSKGFLPITKFYS